MIRVAIKRLPKIFIAIIFIPVLFASRQTIAKPFSVGIELPTQIPVTKAVEDGLKEIGIDYVNYYIKTQAGETSPSSQQVNREMIELCKRLKLDFSISTHHLDPPDDCVKEAAAALPAQFKGMVFDELAHIRLLHAAIMPTPKSVHIIQDSNNIKTIQQAYQAALEGYMSLCKKYKDLGAPVTATHIWPVLHHLAAKAGFTVCPKICKELYSPVSLAIALGAAKQYDRPLWVDIDLWYYEFLPGHSPEEFRCNLLLAYWMGADLVYVEGSGFNLTPIGKQGTPFSIINTIDTEKFQLTPHGEVLRWFCREYLPQHPRNYTFRDIKPDIAIIRFDDSCHGQRFLTYFPDSLFGLAQLPSTKDTEAWLGIWNLLTSGATGIDGLTFIKTSDFCNCDIRKTPHKRWPSWFTEPVLSGMHNFFVPLKGTVVYDNSVSYELLRDIPLLFLSGIEVSSETMQAIRRCVDEGAVCVAYGPLAKKNGFENWAGDVQIIRQGKGRFILTDNFATHKVLEQISDLIGQPDQISYRFKNQRILLKKRTANDIDVEIIDLN